MSTVITSVVTVTGICNWVGGGVFLTCHHGASGEHQWVLRLRWLFRNRWMSRLRILARDRTNRPLLLRDRNSNCTDLFRTEPNHTRDSRICSWLTTEVEMLLTYIYRSTTSRVSYRVLPMYTSDVKNGNIGAC